MESVFLSLSKGKHFPELISSSSTLSSQSKPAPDKTQIKNPNSSLPQPSSAKNPTLTTEITKLSTEIATETTQSAKKITLKTSDDQIFEVEESVAMEFATVKSFFEDAPSSTDTVPLPNVPAKPFSQVIEFCKEQIKFKANPDETEKKKSNSEFVKEKTNEDLVGMIPVANYLEIKDLLDVLNQAVADRIQNRSVEYVGSFFGIDNDFTSEEEALLREEHAWAFEDVDED